MMYADGQYWVYVQILQTRISLITSLIRRPFLLTTMAPVKNARVIFNSVPEGQ